METEDIIQEETIIPTRHHRKSDNGNDRFIVLRQILNIIFMLTAVVGVVIYLVHSERLGIIIVLASMIFKIIECVLRLLK